MGSSDTNIEQNDGKPVTNFSNFTDDIFGGDGNSGDGQWVFILFVLLAAGGCVLNLVHSMALLRCKRNGILSIILQISLVDSASLYTAINETLAVRQKSWSFPPELCPLFKGTEIFINSLTLYLIICFNFQIISLYNLHELTNQKNRRNPLTSCNNSNECLVTRQENASISRTLTIDYRRQKNDVSVVLPTIFVWFVCLSLSVPNFTLSTTLKVKNNQTLCAVIDVYYNQVLQNSLLIFKTLIPTVLLILSLVILILKFVHVERDELQSDLGNNKNISDFRKFLIFGVTLSVVYVVMSFQRHIFYLSHTINFNLSTNSGDSFINFKMPPLYNNYLSDSSSAHLSMLHYLGSLVRALLYLGLLPKFRNLLRNKLFVCCISTNKNNKDDK